MTFHAHTITAAFIVAVLQLPARPAEAGDVSLSMWTAPIWDPVRAGRNPLAVPGAHLAIAVEIEGDGAATADGSLAIALPMPNGTARVRGKVWPAADAEPAAWTIEKVDTIPHLIGSPGIYADGISDVYFDNVKVYRNQ